MSDSSARLNEAERSPGKATPTGLAHVTDILAASFSNLNSPSAGPSAPIRSLIFGSLLLIAVIAVATTFVLFNLYNRVIADSERELQTIALVLAEQADRQFQAVELVQTALIERIQSLEITSSDDFERKLSGSDVHQMLKEKIVGLQHVGALVLINSRGEVFNSSHDWPIPAINVADRSFFKAFQSNSQLTFFMGEPLRNRVTGTWVVQIARKVSGSKGELLGLVVGAIELQYFEDLFRAVTLGPDSSIVLYRRDGLHLARYPHLESNIGKSYAQNPIFQTVLSQSGHGAVRLVSLFDGKERFAAAHSLTQAPIVVAAFNTVDAVLADWRHAAIFLIGIAGLTVSIIGGIVFLFIRQIKTRELLIQANAESAKAEKLAEQSLILDAALNNISQGLVMFDPQARMMIRNRRYVEMYGLSPDGVRPGCTLRELLEFRVATGTFCADKVEKHINDLKAAVSQGNIFSLIINLRDGRVISIVNHPMKGGGWIATHEDITEAKRAEERISHEAYVDALTGLPNRKSFYEQLEQKLECVQRGDQLAILYLDLDYLKRINDTLGHPAGDKLLQGVAKRLHKCAGHIDVVCRLSGDEFAIIQSTFSCRDDAAALATRICQAIHEPFDLDGDHVTVDISIGIAIAPTDATELDELLKAADIALYEAKNTRRGTYCFYEPQLQKRIQNRTQLEQDLRRGLVNGEFELFYQPIANLDANKITSFEALLRWRHPTRGLVSPAEFIPIAEETGLIVPLGEWIIRTACAEAATWPDDIQVAVNISAVQLTNTNLATVIVNAIATAGIPASRLVLEITESVLLRNTDYNLIVMRELHELGVQFSMDDFGTGYSSLGYLLSFPFEKIKIDRSFIADLADKSEPRVIVRAIADLARNLGIKVVAEGVETEQQLQQVRLLGCTEMQGYLLSHPRSATEILQLLPQRVGSDSGTVAKNRSGNNNRKPCRVRPDLVCSHRLTAAECDVMGGIMAGDSCEESARQLAIDAQLVEACRARIVAKHGTKSVADVIQIMLTNGCSPSPARPQCAPRSTASKVAATSRRL